MWKIFKSNKESEVDKPTGKGEYVDQGLRERIINKELA